MEAGRERVSGRPRRGRWGSAAPAAIGLCLSVVATACGPAETTSPPSAGPPVVASASPVAAGSPATTPDVAPSNVPSGTFALPAPALATRGRIALVRADGSLWLVDTQGSATILAGSGAGTYGFPAWAPDGTRVAAVRASDTGTEVVVFDVDRPSTAGGITGRVIVRDPGETPFYLSWTPDGSTVSFLAGDAQGISLLTAPADRSVDAGGTGPGTLVKAGSPFYYDWVDSSHLFAHVGADADAFLGEIGTDGVPSGPAIPGPGLFRSVDVSGDGRFVGFVRSGQGGADTVVARALADGTEQAMPVAGVAAVDFSPIGDTLAAIGATDPATVSPTLPIGPLRLLEARTGDVRTLLDGAVVSFAWSPDGATIAAIRLLPRAPGSNVSTSGAAATPAPSGQTDIRLTFVDVASGRIRSQPVVSPGTQYVNQVLTYFDQYALSHRLWSPDSASFLLPQTDPDGTTHVDAMFPGGGRPVSLQGEVGFWSP